MRFLNVLRLSYIFLFVAFECGDDRVCAALQTEHRAEDGAESDGSGGTTLQTAWSSKQVRVRIDNK